MSFQLTLESALTIFKPIYFLKEKKKEKKEAKKEKKKKRKSFHITKRPPPSLFIDTRFFFPLHDYTFFSGV